MPQIARATECYLLLRILGYIFGNIGPYEVILGACTGSVIFKNTSEQISEQFVLEVLG
jgi:hypothetical protein